MRKNKNKENITEFELQYPGPVLDEVKTERDYFQEYYLAYKNDYISQYLDAYRKLKEEEKTNKQ
jgi:hypothetical protein